MNSQNLVGTIVSLFGSLTVGALFSRKRDGIESDSRLRDLERELESAKGELYVQHESLGSQKSQLEKSAEQIKSRDARIAELESKLESSVAAIAELSDSKAEIESLKAESDSLRLKLDGSRSEAEAAVKAETDALRSKLAGAEAALQAAEGKSSEPPPALVAEIESLRKTVLSQNNDVSRLLERVKELAPLKLQITDRDLRLRQLGAELAEAEKAKAQALAGITGLLEGKDDEIARLSDKLTEREHAATTQSERISHLSELTAQHEFMLGEKDSQIADLQSQLSQVESADSDQHSVLRDKDAAISLLQLRVKELEPLTAQLADRDLKLRRLEDELAEKFEAIQTNPVSETDSEKDAEISLLKARILGLQAELEAALVSANALVPPATIAAEAKGEELEAEQIEEIGHRDEEIARLQARMAELEPLRAQLFARDARLSELESRLQSAISDKESETKHFNSLIAELEPAGARAEAAEARLAKLEEEHRATVNNLEVEISGLRVKLAGLEGASAMLEDCLAKLRAVESQADDR